MRALAISLAAALAFPPAATSAASPSSDEVAPPNAAGRLPGTFWALPCAVGYGVVTTVGSLYLAGEGDAAFPGPVPLLVAGASGFVAGLIIGDNADQTLASGRELTGFHRGAVRIGAGISLASAVGAGLVWASENNPELDDHDRELIAGTVALSALTIVLLEDRLHPAGAPRLTAAPCTFEGGETPGVALHAAF